MPSIQTVENSLVQDLHIISNWSINEVSIFLKKSMLKKKKKTVAQMMQFFCQKNDFQLKKI